MNRIIISGCIKNIDYRLVDKGKVYAILFIELQNEKSEENIQVIAKNGIVVIRNVEKLENGEMDKK